MEDRPISTINTEDLLKSLKSVSADVYVSHANPIVEFLVTFNIKDGHHKVHRDILLELYRAGKHQKIRKAQFARELNKYISKYSHKYFYINKTAFKISETAYKLLIKKVAPAVKPESNADKQFTAFCKYYGVSKGTMWIEGYALYYLYDLWKYNHYSKSKPMSKMLFLKFCETYFEWAYRDHYIYFKVDESIKQHLSDEIRRQLLEGQLWTAKKRKERRGVLKTNTQL